MSRKGLKPSVAKPIVHCNGTHVGAIHELPLQYVKTQNFASLQCKFPLIKGGRGMSRGGLKPSVV